MTEVAITYNYIKDIVVQQCKTNSANSATNWASLPAYFKNGTSDPRVITGGGSGDYHAQLRFTRTVYNGLTGAIPDATIESDMNSFLTNILGLNEARLNRVVNDINFMNYVIDLAIFYTTKVCLITSNSHHNGAQPASSYETRVVYIPSNTDYRNIKSLDLQSIDEGTGELILNSTEVMNQIQYVMNTVANATIRTVSSSIGYGITLVS